MIQVPCYLLSQKSALSKTQLELDRQDVCDWLAGWQLWGVRYPVRASQLCTLLDMTEPYCPQWFNQYLSAGRSIGIGIVYVKDQLWFCYSIVGYYYKALWNAFFWLVSCSGHTLILNDYCPEYGNIVHIIVAKTPLLCFRVLITLLGFILCCIILYICYCMVTLQHHSLFEALALKHVSIVPDVTIFL